MTKYLVILEVRFHGSAAGSTRDEIEADSEAEAIEQAIKAWREVRPDRTFSPLYSEPVAAK